MCLFYPMYAQEKMLFHKMVYETHSCSKIEVVVPIAYEWSVCNFQNQAHIEIPCEGVLGLKHC